jgi:hypothetical protein
MNNVKKGANTGYNPTAEQVTVKEQSAPALKDGDTYMATERGNIQMANEQKGVLTRKNSGNVTNRLGKYQY